MADDALTALLKRASLTDEQRAGLWDVYTASKNPGDLASRLKSLELPDDIKADLWDLKAAKSESIAAPKVTDFVPYPTDEEGRRIDKSGKVVEPGFLDKVVAVGKGENPVATLAIDLLPFATPAAFRAGRSGASAVNSAIEKAPPLVKGGVTYAALKGLNHATGMLPEPLPTIGSVLAAGYGSTPAAAEAVAERAPIGAAFLRPSEPMEPSLDLTRRLRAAHQAATGQTKLPGPAKAVSEAMDAVITPQATEKAVEAAAKLPKMKAHEVLFGAKLKKQGLSQEQIIDALAKLREMPQAWQKMIMAVSDADVAAIVQQANQSGRMVR